MKNSRIFSNRRGFTLMELMVAMAITTIIVTVLVSITSIALDTWNRSRAELRASRQAKVMIDVMARDFEALVIRRGNPNEWLSAVTETSLPGGSDLKSTNASKLIFFTAATDRYNGDVGVASKDLGGDVSCVAYQLDYKDPTSDNPSNSIQTFVLSRLLVDPKPTFDELLGVATKANSLASVFSGKFPPSDISDPNNFIGENLFQFTITFHVQVTDITQVVPLVNIPITLGQNTRSFRLLGNGIESDYTGPSAALLPGGRLTALEISATVVSDFGIDQLRKRSFKDESEKAAFLAKNSYQYTKLVQLPGM
jgi:prepilin-type N-terminal cleavage/methylation domain-containing protein